MNTFLNSANFWFRIKEWFIDTFSNIKFGNVIILLVGIALGFVLFGLVYCLVVLLSFKRKEHKVFRPNGEVKEDEIKEMIDEACLEYKDYYLSSPINEKGEGLKNISIELVKDIARKYYPDSAHPEKEISIDETFLLIHYITSRVDEILNARMLRPFRKYRLSQIQSLMETKKKVEESKVVKAAKAVNAPKIVLASRAVLNAINPAFWVTRGIINPLLGVIYNKVIQVIIRIVGQEAAKIYSKQIISEEDEIDSLMKEISEEKLKEENNA